MTADVKSEVLAAHSLAEKQLHFMRAMTAWTPLNLAVGHQAAFWEGYTKGRER